MTRHLILACAAIAASTAAAAQTAPKPISRADYVKTVDARFNLVDANHDGIVTPEEMKAASGGK